MWGLIWIAGAVWFVVVVHRALRIGARLIVLGEGVRERLTAIENTQTMQFYLLEQVYEMSGLHEQFRARVPETEQAMTLPGMSKTIPIPGSVNHDDPASVSAWQTLMNRIGNRLESVVRWKYEEPSDVSTEEHDPDWYEVRDNRAAWVKTIPILRGWPVAPRAAWIWSSEKPPADVPRKIRWPD